MVCFLWLVYKSAEYLKLHLYLKGFDYEHHLFQGTKLTKHKQTHIQQLAQKQLDLWTQNFLKTFPFFLRKNPHDLGNTMAFSLSTKSVVLSEISNSDTLNVGWIGIKFGAHTLVPLRMNYKNSGDPFTLHL